MHPWIYHEPRATPIGVLANLPHSGVYVPAEIAATWHRQHATWLRNTDWFLPQLYRWLPELGVGMLEATHSRYVADLNRDPKRRSFGPFFEAAVAERTAQGDPIYIVSPSDASIRERILRYHVAYHEHLDARLSALKERFATVLLLDLHSFIEPIRNEICLGDGDGTTCAPGVTQAFTEAFAESVYDVIRNKPFNGGYVVRQHAALPTVHCLQIELRYTTYMDTQRIDEPIRPRIDEVRLENAARRLRPAVERGIRGALRALR